MAIKVCCSYKTPDGVLRLIAKTILAKDPKHSAKNNILTSTSCMGSVAHWLRGNEGAENDKILLFGFPPNYVAHVCIYSATGRPIKDVFNGKPDTIDGEEVYVAGDLHYPLLESITLRDFKRKYLME